MHIRLGWDEVCVERCPQDRKNVGKHNNKNKLFLWVLRFFPVIAPLATQKNVAGCHFRLKFCLEAQLQSHIHSTWKHGLLLKSGSACSLSVLVLSKIISQSWFLQQAMAVVCVRDVVVVEGRILSLGSSLLVCFYASGRPLRLRTLGLDFLPSEAGALLFWSSVL